MYERFTDRARKMMQLAQREAARLRHEYIATEDVLLGLVAEGHGVAANVLASLNIDTNKVRREVERIAPFGSLDPWGRLSPTPQTLKAIEYAHEEAKRFDHSYVGTEHLLLGLIREEEGVAAQVLKNLGLRLEIVRAEVRRFLGQPLDRFIPPSLVVMPLIASEQTSAPLQPPRPINDSHLQFIRKLIERLRTEKENAVIAADFERAAVYRDEEDAIKRLLEYYEWFRDRR